jgi:hypothetical protein
MPDIAKCKGEGCALRGNCYRYTSEPSQFRQAYFTFSPVKPDGTCAQLMPVTFPTPKFSASDF